mmetsp:Transcript_94919/g.163750  ORF Transcript_94919/g.163750 Transcript_94919/m.163750 type:complete len:436 (-) Transcript_94919:1065-2372(-)
MSSFTTFLAGFRGFNQGKQKPMMGFVYNPSQRWYFTLFKPEMLKASPVTSQRLMISWTCLVTLTFIIGDIVGSYSDDPRVHSARVDFRVAANYAFKIFLLWFPFVIMVAGFYDNTAYYRWLKMRDNLRVIIGGGVLVAMHLAAEVTRADVRHEICRYIQQAQHILAWDFRTFYKVDGLNFDTVGFKNPVTNHVASTWSEFVDLMVDSGVCTHAEKPLILESKAPYHLSYEWALVLLSTAVQHGDVRNPVSAHGQIQQQISTMRGCATSTMMHLNNPLPFPYFFLFRVLTLAGCLLAPLAVAGLGADRWLKNAYIGKKAYYEYPMQFIGSMLTTMFLSFMFILGPDMSYPFGSDPCDFDVVKELAAARKLMAQQADLLDNYPHVPTPYAQPHRFAASILYPQLEDTRFNTIPPYPHLQHIPTPTPSASPLTYDMYE